MDLDKISHYSPTLLQFYAKCFVYPYDEMFYELHHMYRILEQSLSNDEEYTFTNQILDIVNNFQGIEFKEFREEYIQLFSNFGDQDPLCPIIASDFLIRNAKHLDSEALYELFLDSGLPFDQDEPPDSLINILEYFSILVNPDDRYPEEDIQYFYDNYVLSWLPMFCDTLQSASGFSYYKDIANSLKEFILWLS